MGVRGLTSFIARHAELYLKPYELHDCNLVIDGDNLACNLYKDVTGTNSAFGGDYDDYYRAIVEFFHVLAECNVRAYVLMDGGYERKKLRTVGQRLRGKISVIKRINPNASIPVFPLLMKEVFVDAVRDCAVPVMRCIFEADDELATLSRKLNCPVLSYDSDFYIHNTRYIPLITLTVKAHTKRCADDEQLNENDSLKEVGVRGNRKMRRNEAKQMQKRTKANRVICAPAQPNAEQRRAPRSGKTYKYLDCCMYRIEHLIDRGSLSKEKLPLFAALLGNDYIARSSFKNFFASVGKGKVSRKLKQQQRRIKIIMQWLRHETAETALEKIMGRLRLNQRESLREQMNAAISGYSNEQCDSYDFFVANYADAFTEFVQSEETENEDESSDDSAEEEVDEEEEIEEDEDVDEIDEEENLTDEDEIEDENNQKAQSEEEDAENISAAAEDEELEDEDDNTEDTVDKKKEFPDWFLAKLYPAHLSRFFVDLVHLRKYINSPQIEHFPHNDCHEIALPILIQIFSLLHNVDGAPTQPGLAEDGSELPIQFTYLTRATRVTNIRYYRYDMYAPEMQQYPFDPRAPNPLLLRQNFTNTMPDVDVADLFVQLEKLPADLRLYFLAIVYWLQKSQHCDLLHLHALLICAVVLRTIDAKIPAERDVRAFQKCYGKICKKERLVRDKETLAGNKRSVKAELLALPVAERMPFIAKSDCLLVAEHLLKHFHMQELFKKKYDHFSTTVLHAFSEFQSIVFQLHALNALLDFPLEGVRMAQLYCGVFLYNIYDLLRDRLDISYYVQQFVFRDSQMMYDFYAYLLQWCAPFVPQWKRAAESQGDAAGGVNGVQSVSKKLLKKRRQAERKKAAKAEEEEQQKSLDPNADMLDRDADEEQNEFMDLNNKFCTFLKIN